MQLYYTPDSLETYIGLSFDEQVDPSKHEGTKPDNVLKILTEYIPPGTCIYLHIKELSDFLPGYWVYFVRIDLMRIDFVGVDFMRIDLVGWHCKHIREHKPQLQVQVAISHYHAAVYISFILQQK